MELCQDKRGTFIDLTYLDTNRVKLDYQIPLSEIIYDFFDNLKSKSRGYASLDYDFMGYKADKLVKLDILLNGEVCDALSLIVHADKAYARGRQIAEKLKEVIPRHLFEIPIQAAIGSKIIARETVKALRKMCSQVLRRNITRKRSWKSKEGKKNAGGQRKYLPAFMSILKFDKNDYRIFIFIYLLCQKCAYCNFILSHIPQSLPTVYFGIIRKSALTRKRKNCCRLVVLVGTPAILSLICLNG